MYCTNCGANAGSAKFCPECGTRLTAPESAQTGGTGTLTLRKYNAERMKEIVADVYLDGTFQGVVGKTDSMTFTLPAGTHELLIHADGCVDAIQKVNIEPLENRLCVFTVDDVGFINIVQQGGLSRSSAASGYAAQARTTGTAGAFGAGAAAYAEQETTEVFSREMPVAESEEELDSSWAEPDTAAYTTPEHSKYCRFCGALIHEESVVCPRCGRQVEELRREAPTAVPGGKPKDKWVAFLLCFFLGIFGIHKFYEGRVGLGILYLCTFGLFGIGWLIDLILLVMKPNPYYV